MEITSEYKYWAVNRTTNEIKGGNDNRRELEEQCKPKHIYYIASWQRAKDFYLHRKQYFEELDKRQTTLF